MALALETKTETSFTRATERRSFFIDRLAFERLFSLAVLKQQSESAQAELALRIDDLQAYSRIQQQYSLNPSSMSLSERSICFEIENLLDRAHTYRDARSLVQSAGEKLVEQLIESISASRIRAFNLNDRFFWVLLTQPEDMVSKLYANDQSDPDEIISFNLWHEQLRDPDSRVAGIEDYEKLIRDVYAAGQLAVAECTH
jgi:hypothetical protein